MSICYFGLFLYKFSTIFSSVFVLKQERFFLFENTISKWKLHILFQLLSSLKKRKSSSIYLFSVFVIFHNGYTVVADCFTKNKVNWGKKWAIKKKKTYVSFTDKNACLSSATPSFFFISFFFRFLLFVICSYSCGYVVAAATFHSVHRIAWQHILIVFIQYARLSIRLANRLINVECIKRYDFFALSVETVVETKYLYSIVSKCDSNDV